MSTTNTIKQWIKQNWNVLLCTTNVALKEGRLPWKCKQDLFCFSEAVMFTSRGRLLSGGNVREAHIPDIQESPEGFEHYSLWKIKQIEWKFSS